MQISCTDCVIYHPGTERAYWHADWPYNATNATHVKASYPDVMMHLSSIWMLTPFTREKGATFVLPGSHLYPNNPAAGGMDGVDQDAPHADEQQAIGSARSVLRYDSRLWHAVAPNQSDATRVALVVWAAGISLLDTSLSAITFMAIPAKAYQTDWGYLLGNLMIGAVAPPVIWYYLPFFSASYKRIEYEATHISPSRQFGYSGTRIA